MRWFPKPRTAISLALALLAACVLIGISETGFDQSIHALNDIAEASRTRASLNRALQSMLDAETGSRGYLLTGDARYLEPYNTAVAEIRHQLDALHAIYTPGMDESAALAELTRSVQSKLAEMDLSVRMRKQGNKEAWKFVLMTDIGKEQMDAIREQAMKLINACAARMDVSQAQVRSSLLLSRVGIAAVVMAGLLAFYLYLRQGTALELAGRRQQQMLQQEHDLLERQVRERTASLRQLATHLQQVREEERGHLARELHDELGALLTAAKLDVARLKSRLSAQPSFDVAQRLQHLTDALNDGIALKRRIIEDLRPSSLANLGLTASLEILAREFSEHSGVEVVTSVEQVELDEARQLTVYRLVQESLTNAGKYAEASQVEISVRNYGNHVEVDIRDNGKGFNIHEVRASSYGLTGMRHRVEAAGGRLTVVSAAGNGTCICAMLPKVGPTA